MTEPITRRGSGWIAFAGIMLTIAGLLDFVNGLWALHHSSTAVDTLFFENNLDNWGWFYVIVGAIVFVAGLAVFARSQLARWIGILAAAGALVANMFWIFYQPVAAITLVILNAMVIYALAVYGGREDY